TGRCKAHAELGGTPLALVHRPPARRRESGRGRPREEKRVIRSRRSYTSWWEGRTMHKIRVVNPQYGQSRPYAGKEGEVNGGSGAESNREGRGEYLVVS